MTREEEVEIISERYGANSLLYGKLHNDTLKGLLKHYQKGFVAGVKWADENPKLPWISVNEKLPPVEKDSLSIKVIVVSTKGIIDFSRYDYDIEGWISPVLDIEFTHWMPIPELPK